MAATTGLLIAYNKCIRLSEQPEWDAWYDDVHLPDLMEGDGPKVATRWILTDPPAPGMPGMGFTHVTIYEFTGADIGATVSRFLARDRELRRAGRIHPAHAVIDVHAFVAHGRWNDKPEPSPSLRSHVLTNTVCTDPSREAEWDQWYDDQHIPDMLESGAFTTATRWRRLAPVAYGSNHMTLYDVAFDSVQEAVDKSAAIMPDITAAGRRHPCHTGAMTLTLQPAGRYGGTGLRPAD
jgi:hypothetical protein